MYLDSIFGLQGKVAVVTGGNKGIGRTVGLGLAKAGAEVVILSRSDAQEAIAEIQQAGGKAWHISTDVTDEQQVENAINQVLQRSQKIDVLFNNAGITLHKEFLKTSPAEFRHMIDVNLTGEYIVARRVAQSMVDLGVQGSIINMASMSGYIVNIPNLQCAYNTSKAAILHMTRSMAVELAPYHIRVNSISPGFVATPMSADVAEELKQAWYRMIPMGRMADPEELVPPVLYLASSASGYTTGSDVVVDGGYTCL